MTSEARDYTHTHGHCICLVFALKTDEKQLECNDVITGFCTIMGAIDLTVQINVHCDIMLTRKKFKMQAKPFFCSPPSHSPSSLDS